MKKMFIALAVLAVAATGCSNDEQKNGQGEKKPLTVQLRMLGDLSSRYDNDVAVAGQITVDVAGRTLIYVLDASNDVLQCVPMTGDAIVTSSNAGVTPGTGQTIPAVPVDAGVYVVANIPSADVTAALALDDLDAIKAYFADIVDQDDYTAPVMANEDFAVVSVEDSGSGLSLEAEVGLIPVFARLELSAVQSQSQTDAATAGESAYVTGFDVTGIYLDQVYTEYTFGGSNHGTIVSLEGDVAKLAGLVTAGLGTTGSWTADTGVAVFDGDDATKTWGFNVPAGSKGFLVVKLENVTYVHLGDSDGPHTIATPRYVTVTGYNGAGEDLEAGKVYQVGGTGYELEFKYSNLYEGPNPEEQPLLIKVEVKDWEFVPYAPDLAK